MRETTRRAWLAAVVAAPLAQVAEAFHDDAARLQRYVDAGLVIPAGTYTVRSPVYVRDGQHYELHRSVIRFRDDGRVKCDKDARFTMTHCYIDCTKSGPFDRKREAEWLLRARLS